ncbi:MAG: integrase, partial [Stutzerimonas stutzeri]
MDERVRFISDWLSGERTVVDLAERYGVSRKTTYRWIDRYRSEGASGLEDRSSAPHRHGRATDERLVELILQQKEERPSWGPRKIIAKLQDLYPDEAWPAASTAGEILKRAGLVKVRRRRFRAPPTLGGLTTPERPNHVWATDHKGWVLLGDGTRCEPLTISDNHTRFLIGLSSGVSKNVQETRAEFERAFADYGLPEVIRSDNGSPFAANGVTGLTTLSVWWAKLGIRHERTALGRPQQNGRHERFHLTLREAMDPPAADRAAQVARFETFRTYYNEERPHEALEQTPPARHYCRSPRELPSRLSEPNYPQEAVIRRVRSNGEIRWAGELIFVSETLIGEWVAIEELDDGEMRMRFYDTPIATLDPRQKRLFRLRVPARAR